MSSRSPFIRETAPAARGRTVETVHGRWGRVGLQPKPNQPENEGDQFGASPEEGLAGDEFPADTAHDETRPKPDRGHLHLPREVTRRGGSLPP